MGVADPYYLAALRELDAEFPDDPIAAPVATAAPSPGLGMAWSMGWGIGARTTVDFHLLMFIICMGIIACVASAVITSEGPSYQVTHKAILVTPHQETYRGHAVASADTTWLLFANGHTCEASSRYNFEAVAVGESWACLKGWKSE